MLELIKRTGKYVSGYRDYCTEFFDNHVKFFVPTNPQNIDDGWFERTKPWYDRLEEGGKKGQPLSFHYWAVDGEKFIGEFQLRTELSDEVMNGIGSVGYSVRVSEQGKGYGAEILRQGLAIAKKAGMDKVLLNINEENLVSIHICEKLGGQLMDVIPSENDYEGKYLMRRYWIFLI